MSSAAPSRRRPFVARIFQSPTIKSWKDAEAPALRRALIAAVDAVRDGKPVVLDLLVDIEAVSLGPKVEASKVLHWRSRPSMDFGASVRRALGFYSGESTLAAAVQVESGAELDALLPGTALWNSEFTIYPVPAKPIAELPDPHFAVPGFAVHVPWALMQDTGESWMVTALGIEGLDTVCATLSRAFTLQQLQSSTADAPDFSRTS